MPQAQIVATFAEHGYACRAYAVDEAGPLGRVEYIGRVPMRVPIGVRPETGEPVRWADLSEDEQADAANQAGPRTWADLTNAQKRNALLAAARAERARSLAPPAEDPGVSDPAGTAVTL